MSNRRRSGFMAYVTVVQLAGLAVMIGALLASHGLRLGPKPAICGVLCALLVVSELWPIPVPRGEAATDEITLSSTIGLALMFMAPLWVVVGVQALALVVDHVVRQGNVARLRFNISQYAISYGAADFVYDRLVGAAPWSGQLVHLRPVPAVAAGTVFFLSNNGLIAGVLALNADRRILVQLTEDIRWQLATAIPATALPPVVCVAALWSPWLLLFVLTPLIAVNRSGQLASRREHEALHDPLTGLGNRLMLFGVLDRAFESPEPGVHAVLLMDLDHFKDVNDTLGHQIGDDLLRAAAKVLSDLMPQNGLMARLGGDEFAVVLRHTTAEEAQELAHTMVEALRQPCIIEGVALRVRGSVGVAMYPADGRTRDDVLRRADVALYKAKESRDAYVAYEPVQDRAALNQLNLVNELSALLDDPSAFPDQLFLAYQPMVTGSDGTLAGVECLVRWNHPRHGIMLPGSFLPLAEHAGLTGLLGRHVFELAVAQQLAWARAGYDLRVSVNVSVQQLSDTGLPELVAQILAKYGVKPSRLAIEVTESCLMSDPERSTEILRRMRATGAHVSIDDYGSGYSSLAYVKQLEVDELKIDRQFIANIREDLTDRIIVQSTIDLAHQLGLRVVAEGVEHVGTAALLREMGADVLQGFALGRPGAADEICDYIPVPFAVRPGGGLRSVGATGSGDSTSLEGARSALTSAATEVG